MSRFLCFFPLFTLLAHALAAGAALEDIGQKPASVSQSDWEGIRAAHEAWKHALQEDGEGHAAANAGQQWRTQFDRHGFLTTPTGGGWSWGLELKSYGFAGNTQTVGKAPRAHAAGQRLTRTWDDTVEEWYVNDQRGLEHGFSLARRPAGAKENDLLVFTLGVRGGLRPQAQAEGQTISFMTENGAAALVYGGLKVWDADGKVLPATMTDSGGQVLIQINDQGARYPVTVDPLAHQAYLKAGNNAPVPNESFGEAVAVSGDTVVIGAPYEDGSGTGFNPASNEAASDAGAVYVFVRNAGVWTQQAYLKASNTGAGDHFGQSVAISGDTLVVGAPDEDGSNIGVNTTSNNSATSAGAAYVFVRSGTTWTQQALAKASNTGGNDVFGVSIAVSGDTMVVGAYWEDGSGMGVNPATNNDLNNAGAAYVFVRNGTTWTQQAYLKAFNTGGNDHFGRSVTVSGDTIVVGASGESGSGTGANPLSDEIAYSAGAAYVFTRSGTTWSQQAYLKASNTGASDYFGSSVSLHGDLLAVGATGEDGSGTGANPPTSEGITDAGAAYVFVRSGTTWSQAAYLKAISPTSYQGFGISVSAWGDSVAVGSPRENGAGIGINPSPANSANTYDSGAAHVYALNAGAWTLQAYIKASNTGGSDRFGTSVALGDNLLVVGAPDEDGLGTGVNPPSNNNGRDTGAAYVLTRTGTTWSHHSYVKASNTNDSFGDNDLFGSSVAASGDTLVVGSIGEDGSGTGAQPASDENASSAGAVYVFVRSGSTWTQQAYLKASNTGTLDAFGTAVAISGDTLVVGAPGEDGSGTGINPASNESASGAGAAYVFVRSGSTWTQQAYLKASNTGASDGFGTAVAVTGDIVVIGSPSEDGSGTGINPTSNEGASSAGAAYIYQRSGTTWAHQAYVKPFNTTSFDSFGGAVAAAGDTVVVGAAGEDGSGTGINPVSNDTVNGSGAAYVFVNNAGTWSQQAYLKASNTGSGDLFGAAVAISGNTIAVGAPLEKGTGIGVNPADDNLGYEAGAAYVFVRSGTTWALQAYLKASNTEISSFSGDLFGTSVAVFDNMLVVGAPGEDGGGTGVNPFSNESAGSSGAAYLFGRNNVTWSQRAYLKPNYANYGIYSLTEFGKTVALTATSVLVGGPREDGGGAGISPTPNGDSYESGAAYVFLIDDPDIALEEPAGTSVADGAELSFGTVALGGSASKTITIRNTGTSTLAGISVSRGGTNSTDLALNTTGMAFTLASGASTTFSVTFTPAAPGARSAFVQVASDDPDESPFDLLLTGTCVAPEVEVTGGGMSITDGSTTPLTTDQTDFGSTPVAGGIVTRVFTIQNIGTAPLLLGTAALAGTHAADFAVTSQPGSTVAPGESTTLEMTFNPSAKTLRTAAVSFSTNDSNENPFNFSLQGTGLNSAPSDIGLSSVTIAENNAANATVAAMSSVDADTGDTLTYSLVGGTGATDNLSFSILGTALRLTSSANFETLSTYSIRLRVSDGTAIFEKPFTITVTDVNEAPTNIVLSSSTLPENGDANATVGSLSASDADAGNTHTFALVSGAGSTDNGSFAIDGTSLILLPSANFEAKSSYAVRIRATDAGTLFFEKQFTVTITNVNEAPTDIGLSASSIVENNLANATVGALSAMDVDTGDTRTYALVAGTGSDDNASFTITGSSLKITPSANFETKNSYSVRLRVTDGAGLYFEKPFVIAVTNVNEAPTDTTLSSSSIAENNAANATVGTLGAADVDASDTHTFTLVTGTGSTDNGSFTIAGTALRLTPSANFETKTSYSIRVRATDAGGLSFDKQFAITVTDVNEAPTDIGLTSASLAENNAANATVGTLSGADADVGDTRTFTLVAGTGDNDNASFNISGASLQIIPSADYETKSSYTVRVRVTDSSGLLFEEPFTIAITNLNEAPTDIAVSSSSLPENNAANATVGLLSATDVDADATHTFTLVSGTGSTDNASFSISGTALRLTPAANFETKSSYSVRIRATDTGSLTVEKVFIISISDVNEAPTNITLSATSIAENNAADAVVGTLSTTDADAGNNHTISLVSGTGSTDNGSFSIDGAALRLTPSANYEAKSSYSIRLRATDGEGLFFEKQFTVTVTNVNEAPTDIVLSGSILAENSAANATVGTLSATDVDAADTRAYSLVSGSGSTDNALFNISGSALRLTSAADFETKSSHSVRVRVTDGGALFFEKVFTITISNINEMPSFVKGADQSHPIRALAAQSIPGWATDIHDGDSTVDQPLVFNVGIVSGGALFAVPPVLSSSGTLAYTPNGTPGTAVLSLSLTDDASINGNPALTTAMQTFTIRVEGPGSVDPLDAAVSGLHVLAVVAQPDGKIILAGNFTSVLGVPRGNIARLNMNGTVDLGFNPNADGSVYAVAVQPDGKILLGGSFTTLQPNGAASASPRGHVARLLADGTLDAAFDPKANSHVRSVAVQADGRVLLAGDFTTLQPGADATATPRQHLARLMVDGTLDSGFDPKANDVVYSMGIQADGKILVGGDFTTLQANGAPTPTTRRFIARLSTAGAVEGGFDPKANGTVYAVTVQPDGKVLLGGVFSSLQPNGAPTPTTRNCIARLNANGSLDTGFNPNADNAVLGFALQADGKVLVGGAFTTLRPNGAAAATERHAIARLLPDGTLDGGFDPNANGTVHGLALQADGRVLAGGEFTTLQPDGAPAATTRSLFARLANDPASRALAVPDFTQISWTYGDAAPVMERVTFELSTDGTNWTALGVGTSLIPSVGWQLAGLTLPASGTIRARGRTSGGIYNGSGGLIEELMSFTVPVPAIAVEDEAGSGVPAGSSMDFGTVLAGGGSLVTQFTVRNTGTVALTLSGVSVSGLQAGDFVVSTGGMATSLAPLARTSFTLTFTPGATGARHASLRVSSNDPDRRFFDFAITGVGVDQQQNWRQQHFGTISNSGDAADTADADRDGIPNLLEWAFNLSPTSPGTLPAAALLNGAFMEFTYTRSVAALNAGAQFNVEWNDSLAPEGWSSGGVTEQILSDNGTAQVITALVPKGSGTKRFMRLSVSTN